MMPQLKLSRTLAAAAVVAAIAVILTGQLAWLVSAAPAARRGGFVQDDSSVNTDNTADALRPSVVVGTLAGESNPDQFVAFTQNTLRSTGRDVLVSRFRNNGWEVVGTGANGGVLNFDRTRPAEDPDLAFTGPNRTVLWATWQEQDTVLFGHKQIFAARLDVAANRWRPAGEDRQNTGHPSLNVNVLADSESPRIIGGATTAGANVAPWVIWGEGSLQNNRGDLIFVKRAVADASAIGGFHWEQVGGSLNIDNNLNRDGLEPDIDFAGPDLTVPWAVWYEEGGPRPARVFASRAVGDFSQPGNVQWQPVPACTPDETACALNRDVFQDAIDPRMAVGPVPGGTAQVPWIVFVQKDAQGHSLIYVSRFDPGGNRFIPVGDRPLNVLGFFSGAQAETPDIGFAGKVPFVTWTENFGRFKQVWVAHLADVRPGFERWDLDTFDGLNVRSFLDGLTPSIRTNGKAPFIAWQESNESDPFPSQVVEKHLEPSGGTWGSNYPPYIRIISPFLGSALSFRVPGFDQATAGPAAVSAVFPITTTCDNINGWNNINEIQFQVTGPGGEVFLGRFVADGRKIYLRNPDQPDPNAGDAWLGGAGAGSGTPLETRYAVLDVPSMQIVTHGADSPAVDIVWQVGFKQPAFNPRPYEQNLRILSVDGDTDFFNVGQVLLAWQNFLPFIARK